MRSISVPEDLRPQASKPTQATRLTDLTQAFETKPQFGGLDKLTLGQVRCSEDETEPEDIMTDRTVSGTGDQTEPVTDTPGQPQSDEAKREAVATKDTAQHQAGEAAQTAKAQTGEVVAEGKQQARNVLAEAKQVGVTRANEQTASAAGGLRQLQEQADALANGRAEETGALGEYARQLADAAGRYADRVDELGFEGIVRETSRYARRRPGAFLLMAAGAGLAAGRLGRGAKDASSNASSATGSHTDDADALPAQTSAPAGQGFGSPAALESDERTGQ